MSEQKETTIMDVVSESRYQAMFELRNLFGTEKLGALEAWVPVITAMQELPQQYISEVAMPIIERFFEEENLNPRNGHSRDQAAIFAPVIAANISEATKAVYTQMQVQAQQRERTKPRILGKGLM